MNDHTAGGPHDRPERVAVLEQIAKHTEAALGRIEVEMREMRTELRGELQQLRTDINHRFDTVDRNKWF
jgi:hypothetical protein